MQIHELRYQTNLLTVSGQFGDPATEPAHAPEFEEMEQLLFGQ